MSFLEEFNIEEIDVLDSEESIPSRLQKALHKHLSILEANWEFAVNCNGVQENNLLLRKEGKEWATNNFESIFQEVLPIQHHDPTGVSYYLFGYFCWHFYKQQKKVPMTYAEFEKIICEKHHLIYMQNETPMEELSKFNTLKLTASATKMVEEEYKLSNMEKFEEIIPAVFETLSTNIQNCRIAEHTLLQRIPNLRAIDSIEHLNSFSFEMTSSDIMTISKNNTVTRVFYRIENETAHFYREQHEDYMPQIQNMFEQVVRETEKEHMILKHFYVIRDTLKEKKIFCSLQKEQEEHVYSISFGSWSKKICIVLKDNKLYRTTGEEILVPSILIHELYNVYLEAQQQNQKWEKNKNMYYQRSKQLFSQLLTKAEKKYWKEKDVITVEGEEYNYMICTKLGHNSIIRIPKDGNLKEAKSLCITSNDHFIPKYDVFSTVVMMLKSKKEKMLNDIANQFTLNPEHRKILRAM